MTGKLLFLLPFIFVFTTNCTTSKVKPSAPEMAVNSTAPIQMVEPREVIHRTKAVIIFNGFPSYYTHNADLAYVLAARMKMRAFIIDYKGLKNQPGKFSFIGSITDAKLAVGELQRRFDLEEVYLVGHSWGGAVALNVMKEYPQLVSRAFLLAPLVAMKSDKGFKKVITKTFLVQNQLKTEPVRVPQLINEYPSLKANYMPATFAKNLKGQIQILHSKEDKVIPFASSARFAKMLNGRAQVIEAGKTHWLSADRPKLLRQAQAFFQSPEPNKLIR